MIVNEILLEYLYVFTFIFGCIIGFIHMRIKQIKHMRSIMRYTEKVNEWEEKMKKEIDSNNNRNTKKKKIYLPGQENQINNNSNKKNNNKRIII